MLLLYHLSMKLKIFISIVCAQIVAIIFLFLQIQHKNNNILDVSVNTIDSKMIQRIPVGELKYFFEPKPNTVNEDHTVWFPYISKQTINSDTLNERFKYSQEKKEGVFRIITLGDSFTYGSHVDTEENWTELLEDYLNTNNVCKDTKKYEVINLGVWGYDFAYETERYIRRGQKYNPDLIIMLIIDFGRVTEHRFQNQNRIILTKEQKEEYRKKGIFYPELSIYDNELSNDSRITYQQKYFDKFMSIYNNGLLMVDFEKNPIYQSAINKMARDYKEITLERTKLSWKNKEYSLLDGHPNTEGHKAIAEDMFAYLIKNKLIPCIDN